MYKELDKDSQGVLSPTFKGIYGKSRLISGVHMDCIGNPNLGPTLGSNQESANRFVKYKSATPSGQEFNFKEPHPRERKPHAEFPELTKKYWAQSRPDALEWISSCKVVTVTPYNPLFDLLDSGRAFKASAVACPEAPKVCSLPHPHVGSFEIDPKEKIPSHNM